MKRRRRRTRIPLIPYLTALGASAIAWVLFGALASAPVFFTVFTITSIMLGR